MFNSEFETPPQPRRGRRGGRNRRHHHEPSLRSPRFAKGVRLDPSLDKRSAMIAAGCIRPAATPIAEDDGAPTRLTTPFLNLERLPVIRLRPLTAEEQALSDRSSCFEPYPRKGN